MSASRTRDLNESRIALVTTTPGPGIDQDDDLPSIAQSLAQAGLRPDIVAWDSKNVQWDSFDAVIIRSTWDYSDRLAEFLSWLEEAESKTTVYNPPSVVRWNSNKAYLRDLQQAAIPTVPTQFVEPGTSFTLPEGEFVIKPTIGAGAKDAARYGQEEPGDPTEHVRELHSRGLTAMIQPYMHNIDRDGERALVLFKGDFSHAIREDAVLGSGTGVDNHREAHPNAIRYTPSVAEIELAKRALSLAPISFGELLYARADIVTSCDGSPCIMELELVEPNLFLKYAPEALTRFSAAVNTLVK